jgi:hypothetical protein
MDHQCFAGFAAASLSGPQCQHAHVDQDRNAGSPTSVTKRLQQHLPITADEAKRNGFGAQPQQSRDQVTKRFAHV